MSPCLKEGVALGYVPQRLSVVGTELAVQIRDEAVPAKVVQLPFYRK
jgi:aminomethyltransferase